jgi:hypothetical protein
MRAKEDVPEEKEGAALILLARTRDVYRLLSMRTNRAEQVTEVKRYIRALESKAFQAEDGSLEGKWLQKELDGQCKLLVSLGEEC